MEGPCCEKTINTQTSMCYGFVWEFSHITSCMYDCELFFWLLQRKRFSPRSLQFPFSCCIKHMLSSGLRSGGYIHILIYRVDIFCLYLDFTLLLFGPVDCYRQCAAQQNTGSKCQSYLHFYVLCHSLRYVQCTHILSNHSPRE